MLQQQDSSTAIHNTGDILLSAKTKYKNGDYQGAIVEYTLAIEFSPNLALAYSCRGDAYEKLGASPTAMADYNRALELDPTIVVAYYRRGNLHYAAKNYPQALADYTQTIALKSDFALAYIGRGYANRELYGESEGVSDWKIAATLFQTQGNSKQHQYVTDLIDLNTSLDTLSGML
jgi:tetratricopeptide (TPR) repeat protein